MSLPLPPQVVLPVAVIGALYLFSYFWTFTSGIYNHFIRPGKNIVRRYGTWAVVTGGELSTPIFLLKLMNVLV
jgi:hypothetical protein